MCGIFCCLTKINSKKNHYPNIYKECEDLIKLRGPDYLGQHKLIINSNFNLHLVSSILWMQGESFTKQPIVDSHGNILLWNGDLFNKDEVCPKSKSLSDTNIVLELLRNSEDPVDILNKISLLRGPFSFIYYKKQMNILWFGRDRLGRHSLLWYFEPNECLCLTSVGKKDLEFTEVPATGIFSIELNKGPIQLKAYLWDDISQDFMHEHIQENKYNLIIDNLKLNSPINYNLLDLNKEPEEEDLEILNIFKLCENLTNSDIFSLLLNDENIKKRVNELTELLMTSVKSRVEHQPGVCQNCILKKKCSHSKIGILFSGGIDSAILAILTHHSLPIEESIDLLNCAFERPKKETARREISIPSSFNVPDRITGLTTYKTLSSMFPERKFNFVQINIPINELISLRETFITNLIYPLKTILDESLGCALWFASRGSGFIQGDDGNISNYTTSARILLAGMGADEQLGGYYRHRAYLKSHGWSGVGKQVYQDLQKISSRNLGRDDRIVSSHGRQARFPFLDEYVVSFLGRLPIWHRCMPVEQLRPGLGDKILLRLVAFHLGLRSIAFEPKRAFQFGCRIANSKEKGDDISPRLMNFIENNVIDPISPPPPLTTTQNQKEMVSSSRDSFENDLTECSFITTQESSRQFNLNINLNDGFCENFDVLNLSQVLQ